MSAWHEKYLGRPWKAAPDPPHSYNCGELLRAVHRDLGIETLPIAADASDLRQCVEGMKGGRYGLEPVGTDRQPKEYDSVFMARAAFLDHCGIAVQTVEGLMVLHCLQGGGVVLDSLADLRGRGFNRFFWHRHKELD